MTEHYKANLILTLLQAGGNQDVSKAFTNSPISFVSIFFKMGRALAFFVLCSLQNENKKISKINTRKKKSQYKH